MQVAGGRQSGQRPADGGGGGGGGLCLSEISLCLGSGSRWLWLALAGSGSPHRLCPTLRVAGSPTAGQLLLPNLILQHHHPQHNTPTPHTPSTPNHHHRSPSTGRHGHSLSPLLATDGRRSFPLAPILPRHDTRTIRTHDIHERRPHHTHTHTHVPCPLLSTTQLLKSNVGS